MLIKLTVYIVLFIFLAIFIDLKVTAHGVGAENIPPLLSAPCQFWKNHAEC